MDIFGVGPLEFLLIVLLALLILGPKELKKTGLNLGRELNKLVRSDTWRTVRQASEKLKHLPNELMREAGIEELKAVRPPELKQPAAGQAPRLDPRPPAPAAEAEPPAKSGSESEQG